MKIESIYQQRRDALKALTDQYDSVAEFCRTFGFDENRIRQLLNGVKNFGEKSAREMEEKCGLEDFYFDSGLIGIYYKLNKRDREEIRRHLRLLTSDLQSG